jgi:hypothetical protein
MNSDLQSRLMDALMRVMRPLARILMGAGITYAQLDEVVKRAFVEQALGDPDARGRTVNVSRVAVRTGLSRKDVSRIKRSMLVPSGREPPTLQVGRAARVLQLWHSEPEYLDEQGAPIDLSFDDDHVSFSDLTRRVGGDVPPGAIRAELMSAGGMAELPNGMYRVQKRFFVPAALGEDLIVGFAFIVAPLLETLAHNASNPSKALVQRVAYSDFLPENDHAEFREVSNAKASNLMYSIDEWLTQHENKVDGTGDASRRVGVGVFCFEMGTAQNQ